MSVTKFKSSEEEKFSSPEAHFPFPPEMRSCVPVVPFVVALTCRSPIISSSFPHSTTSDMFLELTWIATGIPPILGYRFVTPPERKNESVRPVWTLRMS